MIGLDTNVVVHYLVAALRAWDKSSADFSDALLGEVSTAQGCGKVVTFDKAAAKLPAFDLPG